MSTMFETVQQSVATYQVEIRREPYR